jgi:hypothetical protein
MFGKKRKNMFEETKSERALVFELFAQSSNTLIFTETRKRGKIGIINIF